MSKIIKLTESQLVDIVKKTILEQQSQDWKTCIETSMNSMKSNKVVVEKLHSSDDFVSYKIKYDEILNYFKSKDTFKITGEKIPGQDMRRLKEKTLYWMFYRDNKWYENKTQGSYERGGSYTCNNGELILTDTKNKQQYSTKSKKWVDGIVSSPTTTKQPSTQQPAKNTIPQGKKEQFPMTRGMKGNNTMALQKKLGVVGYGNAPTGYFGNLTQAAVTKAISKLGKQYDPKVGLSQTDYNQIMGNQQQPVDNEPWLGDFKTQ